MAAEILADLSRATDSNSDPLSGALWYFYATGTLTPQSVYTTAALSVAHTNPVVADSGGLFAPIYFNASLQYRGILKTAAGVTLQDIDPINAGLASSLAASSGSASIGFIQSGTGAVATTAQKKHREAAVSVDDFGAVGDGTTDDYAAIILAQDALVALGGGELLFTHGKTYKVGTAIPMKPGITYKGTGRSALDLVASAPGAKIITTSPSIFVNAATTLTGIKFQDLFLHSQTGGGHIWDWSLAGVTAKIEIVGITAIQDNAAKRVINGVAAGGVFSIWAHDWEFRYATGATAAAIYLSSPTVNSTVIERFWSTLATEGTACAVPAIHVESTNAAGHAFNVIVRDGVFELPRGGAVHLISCANSGIENCTAYDLSVATENVMFLIDDGASGPVSNNCWIKGCRSTVGSTTQPDCKIDATDAGQAQFTVEHCRFTYLDGGSAAGGAHVFVNGSDITNYQNIAYTRLGGGPNNDLVFGSTATDDWALAHGFTGANPGFLKFLLNGTYKGAMTNTSLLQWAGTVTDPAFYVDSTGEVRTKKPLYPPDGAGAFQSGTSLIAGAGVPGAGLGTDGQFYFRSDGGGAGATHLYFKNAGAWIALA